MLKSDFSNYTGVLGRGNYLVRELLYLVLQAEMHPQSAAQLEALFNADAARVQARIAAAKPGGNPGITPVVSISGAPNITEGGNLAYTVMCSAAPTAALTVNLTYSGTATRNVDYTGASSVVVPAGSTSASLIVTTTDDTAVESSETVIVTLASGTGYTLGSTTSSTGTIVDNDVAAAQPLRTVVQGNVIHNSAETQGKVGYINRWNYRIASGAVSELVLSLSNFALTSSTTFTSAGNALPIQKMSVECNGVVVPVTFNGSRSFTLADMASDQQSDAIPASAFGLTSITPLTPLFVKTNIILGATTHKVLTSGRSANSGQGTQVAFYDPSVTTVSDVDTAGLFTSTGTTLTSRSSGLVPMVLGRFVSGDPECWIILGDSISQGTGDQAGVTQASGAGWAARALTSTDGASAKAFINYAVHGSISTGPTLNAKLQDVYKYANRATLMYGTNDIGTSGNGATLQEMQTRLTALSNLLRTRSGNSSMKILAGHYPPRTSSTDAWATLANQTVLSAGWDTGGLAETVNSWITSQVGTLWNAVTHHASVRDPSSDWKWVSNGTANYAAFDTTHPSTGGNTLMANDARVVMATM